MVANKADAIFTEREKEIIELSAAAGARVAITETAAGAIDHYRIVEKLLYNYKRLETLVRNDEEYLTVEQHGKSKSVVVYAPSGGAYRMEDEIAGDAARERLMSYERTAANFREVEKVIRLFRENKEFIVIRMYYFNEDATGAQRQPGVPQYTWEEIALELSERGILKDEKTARRWRTNMINDIAVCMFGVAGAIAAGNYKPKTS
jgi:G3E family GTPase